jgi:beta-xylosidase
MVTLTIARTYLMALAAAVILAPCPCRSADRGGSVGPEDVVGKLKPLFDCPVRDTCVCLATGTYYLIGTQKETKGGNRAIWAPELHFIKGYFYIAYCINWPGGGTGILKSATGKPEGPYTDIKPGGPLTQEIDASLFENTDGRVYFVYQDGKIARMKDDMSGLAEEPRLLKPANADHVGFEGAFIFKVGKRYFLSCAEFNNGDYDCMVASSEDLYGPYGDRYVAIPHGGHNMFFQDKKGAWWSTFFGSDDRAPFKERPAILRVEVKDGKVSPVSSQ